VATLNLVDDAIRRGDHGTHPCANHGSDWTGHQKACSSTDGGTRCLLAVRARRHRKAHEEGDHNLSQ
jgi:hypothetical protein